MRDLVARLAGDAGLALELTEPRWLSRARFADRIAATLRRDRLLLAGDAAHAWAPIGGHGMNVGVRGAHNLAWKLAAVRRGHAPASLLDTYSAEQIATARAVIREMRFNPLENPTGAAAGRSRRGPAGGLATQRVQRAVEHALSDLGMHHRRSALSWQRLPGPGPRAGDRVPDADVFADGERTRVHRLLGDDRWSLLVPDRGADWDAVPPSLRRVLETWPVPVAVHRIRPVDRAAAAALGRPGLTLVRPDGHIGLRSSALDLDTLAGYGRAHLRTA